MDTRNEDRHVPSTACDSEKSWWLRNLHLIKKSLVLQGTQESEPWKKVAKNLSAWLGGIYPFRGKDKRWSSQKVGFEKDPSKSFGKRKLKVNP